jgi:hypothetical protein
MDIVPMEIGRSLIDRRPLLHKEDGQEEAQAMR